MAPELRARWRLLEEKAERRLRRGAAEVNTRAPGIGCLFYVAAAASRGDAASYDVFAAGEASPGPRRAAGRVPS
ncbi:MAG TPA: hypothetical protein VGW38_27860, partial [Chloroflexota bacterium]|nr:hypothetical protein [Chloroflexota bacterium]